MNNHNKKIGALLCLVFAISLFSILSVSAFDWTGLRVYYNCSTTAPSIVPDLSNDYNLVVAKGSPYIDSLYSIFTDNKSCESYGSAYDGDIWKIDVVGTPFSTDLNNTGTINFWVWLYTLPSNNNVFFAVSTTWDFRIRDIDKWSVRGWMGNYYDDYQSSTVAVPQTWTMLTLTKNATSSCLWINSVPECIPATDLNLATYPVTFGTDHYQDGYGADVRLDEISFFNRSLSASEISDLYNNHVTYSSSPSVSAPIVNLVSPTDENGDSYNRRYVLVNASTSDPVDNITIYLEDGNLNLINHSISFSSVDYVNFSVPADDNYTFWAVGCYSDLCQSTAFSTVYIDTFFPVVDIITPDDLTYWASKPTFLNITATNTGSISKCWFSMDNGVTNITFPSCHEGINNIFLGFNTYVSEGTNVVSVWANDTIGLYSQSPHVHTFYVDTINPQVQYGSSTTPDGTILNVSNTITVNITATDTNLQDIIAYLYNSTGSLIYSKSTTISPNYFVITGLVPDTYLFYANVTDTFGHVSSTSVRMVTITYVAPVIVPTPSITTNSIFQLLNSAGAGLGRFIQIISTPLSIFLILLVMIGVIILIGYTIANTVKSSLQGVRK